MAALASNKDFLKPMTDEQ